MLNKLLLFFIVSLIFSACSDVKFLGAQKYINKGIYAERWFLNPKYDKSEIPKGTAFYGASAEKIKNKFNIKYYITNFENHSTTEIPQKDMWKIKHNGKDRNEQDDVNLFYYIKNKIFIKEVPIITRLMPIKECYTDGWCQLYLSNYKKILYVKRSILYQGKTILNEKEKKELRWKNAVKKMSVKKEQLPWLNPNKNECERHNSRSAKAYFKNGSCMGNLKIAKRICKGLNLKVPTGEHLKSILLQCNVKVNKGDNHTNKYNLKYQQCYRDKGFFPSRKYLSISVTSEKIPTQHPLHITYAYLNTINGTMSRTTIGIVSNIMCYKNNN